MRPRKIAALMAVILLSLLLSPAALAAQFEAEMSPAEMQGPGEASLKLTITNDSDRVMENISVSGLGYSYNIPESVEPGSTVFCPLSGITVTQEMLGQQLQFTVSWTENGESKTGSVFATVAFGSGVKLEASRTADRTQAPTGGQIILTYTITNTGSAPLTGVSLTDKKVAGSKPLAEKMTLLPGQPYSLTYIYTMGDGYVTSAPVVTYMTEGSETPQTYTIAPIDLLMINPRLEVNVSQGPSTPDGTVFTLEIENNGNQTISKISITDEQGNKVNEEPFVLTVGEKKALTYTVLTEEARNVRFTVKGVDATKQPYEDNTKKFEARPYIDPNLIGLSFGAFSVRALEQDGTMRVRFHLNNTGSVPMRNLTIREIELGELKVIEELPVGESDFETELNIGEPRALVFTLDAVDPVGNPYTFTSNLNAAYLNADNAPASSPLLPGSVTEKDSGRKTGSVSETLLTLFIIIAVLTAAAGAALAVLTKRERIYARERRRASQRQYADNSGAQRRPAQPRETSPAGTQPERRGSPTEQSVRQNERTYREKPMQPYHSSRPLREPSSAAYVPGQNRPADGPYQTYSSGKQRPDPQLPFEIRNQPRHIGPKEDE
jgi:hypothetical protein